MKKLFTLVAAAVMAMAANATDFTDNMAITVPGMGTTTQEATVVVDEVENSDGLYNITLKDFSFNKIELGDLKIENVKGDDDTDGFTWFEETTAELSIKLSGFPVTAKVTLNEGSVMKGENLYLNLSISAVGMNITAIFGDNEFTQPQPFTQYTDKMTVDLGAGASDPIEATISIQKQTDGKYTLSLKNFMFGTLGIGNINVADVEGTEEEGVTKLAVTEQTVTITPGDVEGVDWTFGEKLAAMGLKATISGEMTDDKLNVKIVLPVIGIGTITVLFGEDYITAGIDSPVTTIENNVEAIYDLGGRKLNEMQKGINIVRKADGTTVKVLKK